MDFKSLQQLQKNISRRYIVGSPPLKVFKPWIDFFGRGHVLPGTRLWELVQHHCLGFCAVWSWADQSGLQNSKFIHLCRYRHTWKMFLFLAEQKSVCHETFVLKSQKSYGRQNKVHGVKNWTLRLQKDAQLAWKTAEIVADEQRQNRKHTQGIHIPKLLSFFHTHTMKAKWKLQCRVISAKALKNCIWPKLRKSLPVIFHFDVVVHIFTFPVTWSYSKHGMEKGGKFSFFRCCFPKRKQLKRELNDDSFALSLTAARRARTWNPPALQCSSVAAAPCRAQGHQEGNAGDTQAAPGTHLVTGQGLPAPHQSTVWKYTNNVQGCSGHWTSAIQF